MDPCGVIFGYGRHPYTAPARFYDGGPVLSIRWFFAPTGAVRYTGPTIWHPLSQFKQFKPTDGVGELASRYPYSPGGTPAGLDGQNVHATIDELTGIAPWPGFANWSNVPGCKKISLPTHTSGRTLLLGCKSTFPYGKATLLLGAKIATGVLLLGAVAKKDPTLNKPTLLFGARSQRKLAKSGELDFGASSFQSQFGDATVLFGASTTKAGRQATIEFGGSHVLHPPGNRTGTIDLGADMSDLLAPFQTAEILFGATSHVQGNACITFGAVTNVAPFVPPEFATILFGAPSPSPVAAGKATLLFGGQGTITSVHADPATLMLGASIRTLSGIGAGTIDFGAVSAFVPVAGQVATLLLGADANTDAIYGGKGTILFGAEIVMRQPPLKEEAELLLGAESTPGGGGGDPGCMVAQELHLNDSFSGGVLAGQVVWFHYTHETAVDMGVYCMPTAGPGLTITVYDGPDCQHLTLVDTQHLELFMPYSRNVHTASLYIKIEGDAGDGTTWDGSVSGT